MQAKEVAVVPIRKITTRVREAYSVLRLGGTPEQRARYMAARARQDALCQRMEREGIHDETPGPDVLAQPARVTSRRRTRRSWRLC